jgi:hypothetical protein
MGMSGTVVEALIEVMRSVSHVAKRDRNASQGFNFRGIDAVINAVGPALRDHGVLVLPIVEEHIASTVEVGQKRTPMGHVVVRVRYRFVGPDGSQLDCVTVGEAMDSGDKATPKAMSVAFRTALLQALALPTDEPDPDSTSYERSAPSEANPNADLINTIFRLAQQLPTGPQGVLSEWAESHDGQHISQATDVGGLELLRDDLTQRIEAHP